MLALYPGTTCFYEAEVIQPPSRRKKETDYLLMFDDDDESDMPHKPVPQVFVLNIPGTVPPRQPPEAAAGGLASPY